MKIGGGLRVNTIWANNGVRLSTTKQPAKLHNIKFYGDSRDEALNNYYGIGIDWALETVDGEDINVLTNFTADDVNSFKGTGSWGAEASTTDILSSQGFDHEDGYNSYGQGKYSYSASESYYYKIELMFDPDK